MMDGSYYYGHGVRNDEGYDPFRLHKSSSLPPMEEALQQQRTTCKTTNPMQNQHNVSQDSGLSPSPLDIRHHQGTGASTHGSGLRSRRESGSCDEAISVGTPSPKGSKPSRWSFGGFFNRHKGSTAVPSPAPPLPPRRQNVHRKPRPGSSNGSSSIDSPAHDGSRSCWGQKVDFERSSLLISSEDDDEILSSSGLFSGSQSYPELLNEPFPPELDFSQVSHLPPPLPRDPRKNLFLSNVAQSQIVEVVVPRPPPPLPARRRWTSASPGRPMSVSKPQLPRSRSNHDGRGLRIDRVAPIDEYWKPPPPPFLPPRTPPKAAKSEPLGGEDPKMRIATASYAVIQKPSSPSLDCDSPAASKPTLRKAKVETPRPLSTVIETSPNRNFEENAMDSLDCDDASSSRISSLPEKSTTEVTISTLEEGSLDDCDGGSSRFSSFPEDFILERMEPTPAEDVVDSCMKSGWQPLSNENNDPAPRVVHNPSANGPSSKGNHRAGTTNPPPRLTVLETSLDETSEEDVAISPDCDHESSSRTSSSPDESMLEGTKSTPEAAESPRQPGFSSSSRRKMFRKAINEIEDTMMMIGRDLSLLDRAERRDLPTAHQELIAKGRREEEEGGWTTSSSFENCYTPRPRRTQTSRRSAETDDVVFRICRDSNRPMRVSANPLSEFDYSFLDHLPQDDLHREPDFGDLIEPDVCRDDVAVRQVRDLNCHCHQVPPDPQPKFGIPVFSELEEAASLKRGDYLHVKADPDRYKSTFHPMKNHDTVRDDLAFRNLRKDGKTDPEELGIVRDPNVRSGFSCWHHKNQEHESRCSADGRISPVVFYPQKNNKLMKALAEHARDVVRHQNGHSCGGDAGKILTYEEVINDPEVLSAVKKSLGLLDSEPELEVQDENDVIVNGKPRWAGKNVYTLLTKASETDSEAADANTNGKGETEKKPETTAAAPLASTSRCEAPEPVDFYPLKGRTHSSKLEQVLCNEENPALLVLCCILALANQITGIDFMSLIGVASVLLSILKLLVLP